MIQKEDDRITFFGRDVKVWIIFITKIEYPAIYLYSLANFKPYFHQPKIFFSKTNRGSVILDGKLLPGHISDVPVLQQNDQLALITRFINSHHTNTAFKLYYFSLILSECAEKSKLVVDFEVKLDFLTWPG